MLKVSMERSAERQTEVQGGRCGKHTSGNTEEAHVRASERTGDESNCRRSVSVKHEADLYKLPETHTHPACPSLLQSGEHMNTHKTSMRMVYIMVFFLSFVMLLLSLSDVFFPPSSSKAGTIRITSK